MNEKWQAASKSCAHTISRTLGDTLEENPLPMA